MGLNEQQWRAAMADPALTVKIIAGAGTGKTETLAARFVGLVNAGVPPAEILLLTFTDDAAAEMRSRVIQRLRSARPDLPLPEVGELWCHTFHGFAMRLLRQWGWAIGLPPSPRLLDATEQQDLAQTLIAAWEDAAEHTLLEHRSYRWDNGEAWSRALSIFRRLRDSGATLSDLDPHPVLREHQYERFGAERAQLVPLIAHVFADYLAHLRATGVLDYDELIAAAARLLQEQPELRKNFRVVMVDEFQDTNPAQLALLAQLRPDWSAMSVVGDPRQAIYGWRSARANSVQQFPFLPERPFEAHPLTRNYRSLPPITQIANLTLARTMFGNDAGLEPDRLAESLAETKDSPCVSLYLVPAIEDEARLVATEMARLIATGVPARDIALLLRARTHLRVFVDAMAQAGVPFTVRGGSGFYGQSAVRLVSSLLQVLLDPDDRSAAAHILESPLVGLDVGVLRRQPDSAETPVAPYPRWLVEPASVPFDVPDRAEIVVRLEHLAPRLVEAQARVHLMRPDDFLMWLVRASGLQRWWRRSGDPQALRDWHRLMTLADRWRAADPGLTVVGFTRRLRRHIAEYHAGREAGGQAESVPVDETRDAVEITTVHGAKGREWPIVFVADTALPSRRALQTERVLWDEQWKLVISGDEPRSKKGAADPIGELRRDLRQRSIDEERAIWYVALTRARDRLVVTHSGCAVDEHSHFVDAAEALARPPEESGGESIHFFHELWEQVRSQRQLLGEAVFWGPGACSSAPGMSASSAQPARQPVPPIEIPPQIQAAWARATADPDAGNS